MILVWVGIYILCGGLVNDALLIPGVPATALAKLMFLVGLVVIATYGVPVRTMSRLDIAVFLYVIFLLAVGFFAPNGPLSDGYINVASSLLIGIVGHCAFSLLTARYWNLVARAFLFWCMVGVFLGIAQALTGSFYISDRAFESTYLPGLHRASGFTSDPNYFGMICMLGLPIARLVGFGRGITLLVSIALVAGMVLSGSRSTLLVAAAYFGWLWWVASRSAMWRGLAVVVGILIVALLLRIAPDSILMIFDPSSYSEEASRNSLQDRAFVAIYAAEVGMQNPIFGYGLGSFRFHPINANSQVSHNTYLELFAESGLLGVVGFVSLMFSFYVVSRNARIDKEDRKAFFGLIFAVMAMSLFLVTHYSRLLFFVTGFLAGYLYSRQAEFDRRVA